MAKSDPLVFSKPKSPKRVEILRGSGTGYFKRGQYGYVMAVNTIGGMHLSDRSEPPWESKPGELAYLVSKTKDMRGGATWYSASSLRFTQRSR
jgi:hypothetical protein